MSTMYFTAAVTSYLALGVIALFTVVPPQERSYCAPVDRNSRTLSAPLSAAACR